MAGIKLKSGADFCNFQATRMCLHNDPADPTSDFGNGRIYFNTSSSVGSGKHVRIYDGSNFRSLAYYDEVDSRIKTIEDMLSVDTAEGVVSTWNEIQAFLDSVQEGTDLMDLLNGKLSTKGGTIEGEKEGLLTIKTSATNTYIGFSANSKVGYLGLINGVFSLSDTQSDGFKTILHEGNIGSYKAGDSDKLGGKTLSWVQGNGLKFCRVKTATNSDKADANADLAGGGMIYNYSEHSENIITHSPSGMRYGHIWQIGSHGSDSLDGQFAWDSIHGSQEDTTSKLWWRSRDTNGWTYAKWHQIAFTDSNVASATRARYIETQAYDGSKWYADEYRLYAKWVNPNILGLEIEGGYSIRVNQATKLETPRTIWGQSFDGTGDVSGDLALNQSDIYWHSDKANYCIESVNRTDASPYLKIAHYGGIAFHATGEQKMLINSSGNVTIGSKDSARTVARLCVDGNKILLSNSNSNETSITINNNLSELQVGVTENGTAFLYTSKAYDMAFSTSGARRLLITAGGNVGIGIVNPTERLHVVGNLYVTGNIIADGEVSAGGAGTESGTGGGGTSGGGDALIYSQEFTPSTQVVSIAHGLSATKGVIVQVWEQNADGQSWSVVLVDIEEVDSNNIKLNFGRTETTLHKVVVMG